MTAPKNCCDSLSDVVRIEVTSNPAAVAAWTTPTVPVPPATAIFIWSPLHE
ncbi:hypothetical protein [Nocardioides sp.]|uniref:hypothetical protein n=1 Tax=Nocardioides sp. TaxID=35761 RepID=UPI003D107311